ncbi:MAG: T9SS type A sorting domain-containing protein, partial [Bacteroidales bacterium]
SMSGSVFPEQEYIAFMLSDKPLSPDVYLVIRNADTQTETERIRLNSNLSELGILRKFDKGKYTAQIQMDKRTDPVSNIVSFQVDNSLSIYQSGIINARIFPNPTDNRIVVEGITVDRAELYSVNGQLIRSYTGNNENEYSLQNIPSGYYEFKVYSGNEQISFKVIRK